MAVAGTRVIALTFTGSITYGQSFSAAANAAAAGEIDVMTLALGANTITVPTSGTVPTAVTIIPPAGNTQLITLKGLTGDTGVPLHKTDPSSFGLDSTAATFVLTAAGTVTGLRLIWT